MRGITKRFPGVVANDQVDFEARVGEVHALLGENGAGKTHALEHPHRALPARRGRDRARRRSRWSSTRPRDALDAGIGMVHQHFRLVEPFTVAENVVLGDHSGAGRAFRLHPRAIEHRVRRARRALRPRRRPTARGSGSSRSASSSGSRSSRPSTASARMLILDEPTAVLTPQEADGAVRDAAARWPPRDGRSSSSRTSCTR